MRRKTDSSPRRTARSLSTIALAAVLVALPGNAAAEDPDQEAGAIPLADDVEIEKARLEVIQNRKYDLLHEFSFLGGGMPVDPYYKGVTGTFGYTLHLTPAIAWEVAQFTYSFNFDTKLKKELFRIALATGADAPEFPEINWIVATHLVLKPLYGKEAIFNTRLVHIEAFLQVGGALVHTDDMGRSNAPGIDFGAGLRLWIADATSVRLDLGELIYFLPRAGQKKSEVKQALHLHVGFAFNYRGED